MLYLLSLGQHTAGSWFHTVLADIRALWPVFYDCMEEPFFPDAGVLKEFVLTHLMRSRVKLRKQLFSWNTSRFCLDQEPAEVSGAKEPLVCHICQTTVGTPSALVVHKTKVHQIYLEVNWYVRSP